MFIDTFVCEVYLWTLRNYEREAHAFATSTLLPKNAFDASKNELTHGMAPSRRLFFEFSIERHGNINRGAYRFLFHRLDYFTYAINMEARSSPTAPELLKALQDIIVVKLPWVPAYEVKSGVALSFSYHICGNIIPHA